MTLPPLPHIMPPDFKLYGLIVLVAVGLML